MRIEWDQAKNRQNRKKHGISFEEAGDLLAGSVDYLEIFDEDHSVAEDRFICIGPTPRGIIVVVKAEPEDDVARILSARPATRREIVLYRRYLGGT